MRSFEIQLYQGGTWKINAIFDDQELALFEARRMVEGGRHAGVRVVSEEFDQETGQTRTKTVFRNDKISASNDKAVAQKKEIRGKAMAARKKREVNKTRVRTAKKVQRKKTQRSRQTMKIFAILIAVVGVGLAAMIGLQYLQGFL